MTSLLRVQAGAVGAAAVWLVACLTAWHAVPMLGDEVALESVVVGGLLGVLTASVAAAYERGKRDGVEALDVLHHRVAKR